MANCEFCNKGLSNNKKVAYRCTNCGAVWCANGNCPGSLGQQQYSRTSAAVYQTCKKVGGLAKV